MMDAIRTIEPSDFAAHGLGLLSEIPQPPKALHYRGQLPGTALTLLSIVGSRNYTSYGKQVVEHLVAGLADYPIGIVSGLALGIDSLAHEAALRHGLYTLAIPGGGLSDGVLYPAAHRGLAERIRTAGGGLLSEFDHDFHATKWSFTQRNRLVAGVSPATLIIEAAEKSGTLITARLATDYNRELLVVPGSIFSKNAHGSHQFLKLGATPVTSPEDIIDALQLPRHEQKLPSVRQATLSPEEAAVLTLLREPKDRDTLLRALALPAAEASSLLMEMELKGLIASEFSEYRSCL